MKIKLIQYYLVQICIFVISAVTLFVTYSENISPQVTPKKILMFGVVAFAGLMYLFMGGVVRVKATFTWNMCLIIGIYALIQYVIVYGIGLQILFPLVCILMIFLWMFWAEIIEFKRIATTLICFACFLSLHGLCQYLGMLNSYDYNFPITGSFDNPAGFSSALSCLFPFCLFYYKDNHRGMRFFSWAVSFLIALVIVLSESRTGILVVAITFLIYMLVIMPVSRKTKILLISSGVILLIILYFWKKDSADGRLLIWWCALNMFMDKPIIGHGFNTFQAKYMLYQSEYFKAHPDSSFSLLADNTIHPFNEYLLILTEHGIMGLIIVLLFVFLFIRTYLLEPSRINLIIVLSLLSLAIFSFFSYPFKYPFNWFVLFMNIAYLCRNRKGKYWENEGKMSIIIKKVIVAFCSLVILIYSSRMWKMKTAWYRISQQILVESKDELLIDYEDMYSWLGKNGLFLYNYAAELHQSKKYTQSIEIFTQCLKYYNDMYVQMLMADRYHHNKDYQKAEYHYIQAANMCPSRYIPLYQLVQLYRDIGRRDEALVLANRILEKKIKVESSTVYAIKYEMKEFIDNSPKSNSSND